MVEGEGERVRKLRGQRTRAQTSYTRGGRDITEEEEEEEEEVKESLRTCLERFDGGFAVVVGSELRDWEEKECERNHLESS